MRSVWEPEAVLQPGASLGIEIPLVSLLSCPVFLELFLHCVPPLYPKTGMKHSFLRITTK